MQTTIILFHLNEMSRKDKSIENKQEPQVHFIRSFPCQYFYWARNSRTLVFESFLIDGNSFARKSSWRTPIDNRASLALLKWVRLSAVVHVCRRKECLSCFWSPLGNQELTILNRKVCIKYLQNLQNTIESQYLLAKWQLLSYV